MKCLNGVLVLLMLSSSACASKTPAEACNDLASALCDQLFKCTTESDRAAYNSTGFFGTDAASCKPKLESEESCSAKKVNDDLCVGNPAGSKYSPSNGDSCLSQLTKASCADFLQYFNSQQADTSTVPACGKVCGN